MTLVRELIDIPTQVLDGDFVLKLAQGVDDEHAAQTLADYVVTPDLVRAFDQALGIIAGAIDGGSSQATFLHGSFGSGKSHFMAVLHLLLQGNPQARAIPELAPVIARWDSLLAGKRHLLVPIHFLTARSMDSAILGQYVAHVQAARPGAALPAVFLADRIVTGELPGLRARLGEAAFLAGLNDHAGDSDENWGEFAASWDSAGVDAALAAPATDPRRRQLTAAYVAAYRPETPAEALATGEGFVDLDNGLAAISAHARTLGYDSVVLFLDELILWLASSIGNLDFVQRESQKLTKLVEGTNAHRPVPIVSFVARQRDLRELVGDHVVGAELRSFADNIELQQGRFGLITLEDRDLPFIARRRLLQPVSEAAAAQLRRAVDQAIAGRTDVLDALLTSDADLELFRTVYPFSPAVVQALIAVSEALQRERTALKVMLQLLVDHRDDLEVGQLIPVGDLWDVVAARDEPFSPQMRHAFETAKRLYRTKLRPLLLAQHQLTDTTPAEEEGAWVAFRNDDRLVKTILLAALVERVDAFRRLDAARLVALNWGSVTSPIPGRETSVVATKLRTWNASVGELKVGDDPANPTVAIALVDVDTEALIDEAARAFDNAGARRRTLRDLLDADLGQRLGRDLTGSYELLWRGTPRQLDVAFGNLRDATEVPDATLRAALDRPKLFIDFPLDDQGRSPEDDLDRLDRYAEQHEPTRTVCWLPSFFNSQGLAALRTFVAVDELLRGDRYEQHTSHLSHTQRLEARPVLESRRSQLREQLRAALLSAYGVTAPGHPLLDPANSLTDHFRSLDPGLTIRPTTQPTLAGAFDELGDQILAQQYPGHPRFDERVTRPQLQTTWAEVRRALDSPDGRIVVEQRNRPALRNVANALGLGTMHESHFLVGRDWLDRLDRHLSGAHGEGRTVTVADMRAWIDTAPGGPRGLPGEIADLVVLTVAAQTDHSLTVAGRAVPPEAGRALPAEAVLRAEELPDSALWASAVGRAQAVFGINASPRVSAAEMALLAEKVGTSARGSGRTPAELTTRLEKIGRDFGLDDGGDRLRTARAAAQLVDALRAPDQPPLRVVRALAEATVPTSDNALGTSLSSAPSVLQALSDTNAALLLKAGAEVLDPLRAVLIADEFACGDRGYDIERRRLEQRATEIVIGEREPGDEPDDRQRKDPQIVRLERRTIHSRGELDRLVYEELAALLDRAVPVEITWTPPTDIVS